MQILCFGAAALAFAIRPAGRRFGASAIAVAALIGIALLGCLQLLALPAHLLEAMAPWSLGVYGEANRVIELYGRQPVTPRISVAPKSTVTVTLLTLAYAAAFTAAVIAARSQTRRRVLVWTLVGASGLHVLIAVAMEGGMTERTSGAFVNPNNFAGYLQIGAAFAFGIIWLELLKGGDRVAGIHDPGLRFQRRAVPLVLRVLLWGVLATGIGATRSRGGIAAACLTTLILLGLAAWQQRTRSRHAALGALTAIVVGLGFAALTMGTTPLLRFLASDPREAESDTRVRLWRISMEAFERAPIAGTGLGTFREAFRHVQPPDLRGLVEQAHNDFLQMLVTGGVIGATLIVVAVGSFLIVLVRRWTAQTRREESAMALAGIGALLALLLHGIVEFNMSIPAIPATLATMLGVSWAAANAPSRSHG